MWDVDGTLLHDNGRHFVAYLTAFAAFTGIPFDTEIDTGGRTDAWITAQVFAHHGLDIDGRVAAFHLAYAAEVAALPPGPAPATALPGVAAALAAVAEHDRIVQTLVTGNIEAVGVAKVRNVGLDGWFDTAVGGYGDDHEERAELVRVSRARAEAVYGRFADADVVVVGDTAHDVAAARDCGVVAVAVATGRIGPVALAAAGADHVLSDLTDLDAVLAVLVR